MSKIIVRNTKTGEERPMTQKSFDYLSSKKRGFEFVRKDVQPGSIEDHKARLLAEKAAKEAEKPSEQPVQAQSEEVKKSPGRPKKQEA